MSRRSLAWLACVVLLAAPVAGRAGGGATFDAASAGPAGVETPITPTDLEIRVQVTVTTSHRAK